MPLLEKSYLKDTINKARSQDVLFLVINKGSKDSKKNALAELDKFLSKGTFEVIVVKK